MTKSDMLLWLDDHRGRYIPRDFARSFDDRNNNVFGVTEEDWTILEAGPDHEYYWEVWDDVLNNATVTMQGVTYTLHQDGALWLIPDGMTWSEDSDWFEWPKEVQ